MSVATRRSRNRSRPGPRHESARAPAFLERRIPPYDLLSEEALQGIEDQAEWILQEIGVEIRDDPIALDLFREAGVEVEGERLRFDRGQARALCQTAPRTFTMYASCLLYTSPSPRDGATSRMPYSA